MNLPDFLVEDADAFVHLAEHRIGLHDIVYHYKQGHSAEALLDVFPTLPLAVIHKVIAFYLEHQAEVDAYIAVCEAEIAHQRATAPRGPDITELRQRLATRQAVGR